MKTVRKRSVPKFSALRIFAFKPGKLRSNACDISKKFFAGKKRTEQKQLTVGRIPI